MGEEEDTARVLGAIAAIPIFAFLAISMHQWVAYEGTRHRCKTWWNWLLHEECRM